MGWQPTAAVVNGPWPVRHTVVPLRGQHGKTLTVLFGANGAGKSLLLAGIRAALDETQYRATPWVNRDDAVGATYGTPVALYGRGEAGMPPGVRNASHAEAVRERVLADVDGTARKAAESAFTAGIGCRIPTVRGPDYWLVVDRRAVPELDAECKSYWRTRPLGPVPGRTAAEIAPFIPECPKGMLPPLPSYLGSGFSSGMDFALVPLLSLTPYLYETVANRRSIPVTPELADPTHVTADDVTTDELDHRARAAVAWWAELLTGRAGGVDEATRLAEERYAKAIGAFATHKLRCLFPSWMITIEALFERNNVDHSVLSWTATVADGSRISLDQLSSAEVRWARTAIALADLRGHPTHEDWDVEHNEIHDLPVDVLTIDEPERGLHRQAVRQLGETLRSRAQQVIVASHALEMLEDRSDAAHLMVIRLPRSGVKVVSRPASNSALKEQLEFLGISSADLSSLYRGLLFVEGKHDELVVRQWLGDVIAELGLQVIALYDILLEGNKYARRSQGDVMAIARFVPGPIMYLVDQTQNYEQGFKRFYGDYRRLVEESRTDAAEAFAEKWAMDFQRQGLEFARSLANLLADACRSGTAERVSIHHLRKADIVQYLPCDTVTRGRFSDWSVARQSFVSTFEPSKRTGVAFKSHCGITAGTIQEALEAQPAPPREFREEFGEVVRWIEAFVRGQW